jgi:hypothetical protein
LREVVTHFSRSYDFHYKVHDMVLYNHRFRVILFIVRRFRMWDVEEYNKRQAFNSLEESDQRIFADIHNVYEGSLDEEEFEDLHGVTLAEAEQLFN